MKSNGLKLRFSEDLTVILVENDPEEDIYEENDESSDEDDREEN